MGIRGSSVVRCPLCGLHRSDCMCAELPRIAVPTRVVVFAHALDVQRPSNTGRLVAHMLEHGSLVVHGKPDNASQQPIALAARPLVLHPDGRPLRADDVEPQPCLLVPDGTWAQTRRMLRRIGTLRHAERVSVVPRAVRTQVLRRQPQASHVCTLEAVATALGVLGYQRAESQMLEVLERLTERGLRLRGVTTAI